MSFNLLTKYSYTSNTDDKITSMSYCGIHDWSPLTQYHMKGKTSPLHDKDLRVKEPKPTIGDHDEFEHGRYRRANP